MNNHILLIIITCLFIGCNSSDKQTNNPSSVTQKTTSKPNVVVFLADDLGYNDISYTGAEYPTPNIDKLATGGVFFSRFYAHTMCTPSRAALLTGKYPGRSALSQGVIKPKSRTGLDPEKYILPEIFKDAGYKHRACIGKWHLGHSDSKYHPLNQGFTYFYGHYGGMVNYFTHKKEGELDWHKNFQTSNDEGYTTNLIGKNAVEFIKSVPVNESFFMYIPFNAPHTPLQAPEKYLKKRGFNKDEPTFSGSGSLQGKGNTKRQTYSAMVQCMDDAVGNVVQVLKRRGLLQNTIIVFLSDNGGSLKDGASNFPFKGGKGNFYEGGVRVPAIVYYPALNKTGIINDVSASVDILPTLADFIGLPVPKKANFDGQSFKSALTNNTSNNKEERTLYISKKAIIKGDWKLVDDKLFNLSNDKEETTDLSGAYPAEYQRLKDELLTLSEQIEKPMDKTEDYKLKKNWKMP